MVRRLGRPDTSRPLSRAYAEPSYAEVAEPSYAEVAEPSYAEVAEPSYAEVAEPVHNMASEPWNVEATESSYVDDALEHGDSHLETMSDADQPTAPEPDQQAPRTSASFEAALAAIRAAWVKPEYRQRRHLRSRQPSHAPPHRAKWILTNAIDGLAGRRRPLDSPREASGGQPEERPEKVPGRKMGATDGRSARRMGHLRLGPVRILRLPSTSSTKSRPPKKRQIALGGILFR